LTTVKEYNGNETFRPSLDRLQELKKLFGKTKMTRENQGGFLHPNEDNKYHINNTGAVKNEDGTKVSRLL